MWPYPIQEDIFYSWIIRTGKISFEWFDEISEAFRIGFQVHKMKAVNVWTITAVKYAPEEQCEMQYTEISSNHSKDNLPLRMIQL